MAKILLKNPHPFWSYLEKPKGIQNNPPPHLVFKGEDLVRCL